MIHHEDYGRFGGDGPERLFVVVPQSDPIERVGQPARKPQAKAKIGERRKGRDNFISLDISKTNSRSFKKLDVEIPGDKSPFIIFDV